MTDQKNVTLINRLNEIDDEIRALRDEHERNRSLIAPLVTRQLEIWRNDLDRLEHGFVAQLRNQIDRQDFSRIDYGTSSAIAYFSRDMIEQRLPRLAFLAHGPSVLRQNRCGYEFRDCLRKIDELNLEKIEISESLRVAEQAIRKAK